MSPRNKYIKKKQNWSGGWKSLLWRSRFNEM